jgi:DNA polymerase epsilon subunit 1
MAATTHPDEDGQEVSGLDMFFLKQDGSMFKATLNYLPYFYILVKNQFVSEVPGFLTRRFGGTIATVQVVQKVDLDLPNHLSGLHQTYLKLSFRCVEDLQEVKRVLRPAIERTRSRAATVDAYAAMTEGGSTGETRAPDDILETITDMREMDVPYYVRCSIDNDIRVGAWYTVWMEDNAAMVKRERDFLEKAEPKILAFDIECCKAPLKFPNAKHDEIYMISYMVDGQGYLISSRTHVSQDIDDFEYTPKPQYPGPFSMFNEANERELLLRFFSHVRELRPHIFVTYNGDFFDWPYIDARSKYHGINMTNEIGIYPVSSGGSGSDAKEYRGLCCVHLDCFNWVKRDSYLPQGAHGLKVRDG